MKIHDDKENTPEPAGGAPVLIKSTVKRRFQSFKRRSQDAPLAPLAPVLPASQRQSTATCGMMDLPARVSSVGRPSLSHTLSAEKRELEDREREARIRDLLENYRQAQAERIALQSSNPRRSSVGILNLFDSCSPDAPSPARLPRSSAAFGTQSAANATPDGVGEGRYVCVKASDVNTLKKRLLEAERRVSSLEGSRGLPSGARAQEPSVSRISGISSIGRAGAAGEAEVGAEVDLYSARRAISFSPSLDVVGDVGEPGVRETQNKGDSLTVDVDGDRHGPFHAQLGGNAVVAASGQRGGETGEGGLSAYMEQVFKANMGVGDIQQLEVSSVAEYYLEKSSLSKGGSGGGASIYDGDCAGSGRDDAQGGGLPCLSASEGSCTSEVVEEMTERGGRGLSVNQSVVSYYLHPQLAGCASLCQEKESDEETPGRLVKKVGAMAALSAGALAPREGGLSWGSMHDVTHRAVNSLCRHLTAIGAEGGGGLSVAFGRSQVQIRMLAVLSGLLLLAWRAIRMKRVEKMLQVLRWIFGVARAGGGRMCGTIGAGVGGLRRALHAARILVKLMEKWAGQATLLCVGRTARLELDQLAFAREEAGLLSRRFNRNVITQQATAGGAGGLCEVSTMFVFFMLCQRVSAAASRLRGF